ncbi:MAG TPA: hypothetical protein DIW20_10105 [Rhodospirillaceae bacterium]|nr:hypothetical protein [Rhodospirillaceae bacterium]
MKEETQKLKIESTVQKDVYYLLQPRDQNVFDQLQKKAAKLNTLKGEELVDAILKEMKGGIAFVSRETLPGIYVDGPDGAPSTRWYHDNGALDVTVNQHKGYIVHKKHNRSGVLVEKTISSYSFGRGDEGGEPAICKYDDQGKLFRQEHYYIGSLHDPDETQPAVKVYNALGNVVRTENWESGALQRVRLYNNQGVLVRQELYNSSLESDFNDVLDGAAAIQEWDTETGEITLQQSFKKGKLLKTVTKTDIDAQKEQKQKIIKHKNSAESAAAVIPGLKIYKFEL